MKKNLFIAVLLAGTILFSSCATIISGNNQKINVKSNPSHQKIIINSQIITTPAIVTIERSKKNILINNKNSDNQKLLESKINPWFWGNILIGGVIGSSIDYATGAMWKYDDNVTINYKK